MVTSAYGSNANAVTVNFSEKMSNTIENLQAFTLNGSVFPNSISPASQYSYLLTFRDKIPVGLNDLSVSGLRDLYGSSIQPIDTTFTMDTVIVNSEFFIASFKIIDSYNLKVVFNLEVDEQSALNVNNYIFEPDNKASVVSVDATNKKIVNISLKGRSLLVQSAGNTCFS